ncbi:MAG: adenine phosphoribosyltransferase [Candidatus Melainabacteria bacterium]|nr:adenine phosphoribosyltransferase [Candidatus Melainabacteria bacterium]
MSQPRTRVSQQCQEKNELPCLPLTPTKSEWLKSIIRDVPDFPKPGIIFKDLTTLLKNAEALRFVVDALAERYGNLRPDYVAAIEARGFILGPAIAHQLNAGFVPLRKPGKLPYKVQKEAYELEYGTDAIEVHVDAVEPGARVVLVDDLLATGGTALAAYRLLKKLDADVVGVGFVVELAFLEGRKKLPTDTDVFALLSYK